MSWIFNRLLKKHSKREVGRIKIHKVLQEQVCEEYNEQTVPGNVYNNQIEVIMSNEAIQKAVEREDAEYLKMVKRGTNNAFDEAIEFIENEKNIQMNKDYIPYKLALTLKELGFNKDCFGFYSEIDNNKPIGGNYPCNGNNSAPLFQQVFDWFEDTHSIYVSRTVDTSVNEILDFSYKIKSWKFPPVEIEFEDPYDCFDRYKARISCLEKMIEIVK